MKTQRAQEWRLLLTQRRLLVNKLIDVEAEIRGTLRSSGLRIRRAGFAARMRDLLTDRPSLLRVLEPILLAQATLLAQREALHRMVLQVVRAEEACRRMMTVPGVGLITALAFRARADQAKRFTRLRDVVAHVGLTPLPVRRDKLLGRDH